MGLCENRGVKGRGLQYTYQSLVLYHGYVSAVVIVWKLRNQWTEFSSVINNCKPNLVACKTL